MADEPDSPRDNKKGHEAHWQTLQKRTFARYINAKLKSRGLAVNDLYEDLKSGVILYNFLEVLTGESLKKYGKMNTGKMRIQHVANQNVVFKFFPDADIKLENIGVMDIIDGRPTCVLGLIWSIIAFYLVRELGNGDDDLAAVKKKILKWCKKHAGKKVPVNNLTESFKDGKAFLAILNDIDNAGSPYHPSASEPCDNFRTAFHDAEEKYGLPQVLDGEDPDLWQDEISMLTYLATMMDTLPDSVPQPDPHQGIFDWVESHSEEMEDDLEKLCKCASTPGDAAGRAQAAEVVKELMGRAGLEPAACWSDALGAVVACSPASPDPDKPTLLIYCTTGLQSPDPAQWALGTDKPFEPTKRDGRLFAAAARGDKCSVVAPLYAIRALSEVMGDAQPCCNFKIVVGASPESQAVGLAVDAADAGPLQADFVVVSESGASGALAAVEKDTVALLYGCRGWLRLTVSCAVNDGTPLACASHVGPLLDPAMALCSKVASLRDAETAAPPGATVAGLPALSLDFVDVENATHDVEQLLATVKQQAGYHQGVQTAPEFTKACAEKYALKDVGAGAALCFEPGLVVQRLWTEQPSSAVAPDGARRQHDQAVLPHTAHATLHAMLPPGYTDLEAAADAIVQALLGTSPMGFALSRDGPVAGQAGYLSDSRQPFCEALAAANRQGHGANAELSQCAAVPYAPVAAAFSRLLPTASVFQCGAPKRGDKVGMAGESVATQDVVAHTKALCRLLTDHMQGVPKHGPPKLTPYVLAQHSTVVPTVNVRQSLSGTFLTALDEDVRAIEPSQPTEPPAVQDVATTPQPPQATEPVPAPVAPAPPQAVEAVVAPVPVPVSPVEEPAAPSQAQQAPATQRREADAAPLGPTLPVVEDEIAPVADVELTSDLLVAELNLLRSDPRAYVRVLESMLELYKEDKSFWPREHDAQAFMTHEGCAAVTDAIAFLQAHDSTTVALRPLKQHAGMCRAAADHADDLVLSGERLGHTGSDGSKPAERLARHGRWFERASECLAYRHRSAPMLIAQLVVDDGMPSRTQRATVLSPDMRAVGAALAKHSAHGVLAVVTFAGGYGPHPLTTKATVECRGDASADFQRVLDSIPVLAVHEQVEQALQRGDKVELKYEPGALKMTIWGVDGAGQMYGVEWEK